MKRYKRLYEKIYSVKAEYGKHEYLDMKLNQLERRYGIKKNSPL